MVRPQSSTRKIQTSPPWGRDSGQIPESGDHKNDQMPHICPASPPLGLNIDTPVDFV